MVKSRDEIITSMCYTWRHDYGLERYSNELFSPGMTTKERKRLWDNMAQIFDNDIAPNMVFKQE
jgi:hypothetical protein